MTRSIAFVVSTVLALTAGAVAQTIDSRIWSAIANTGTVDEADHSIYLYHGTGSVAIKPGVSKATLDIRYNVTGLNFLDGLRPPDPDSEDEGLGGCVALRAVIRDTGPGARVIVKLQQLDLFRGTGITTLGQIDSDASLLASTEYHRFERCLDLPWDFQFEYGQFVYFVEAQLIKTSSAANPGLKAVSICNRTVMCDDN